VGTAEAAIWQRKSFVVIPKRGTSEPNMGSAPSQRIGAALFGRTRRELLALFMDNRNEKLVTPIPRFSLTVCFRRCWARGCAENRG
jgi:hypothetical protein